jgi:hypothetical protein
MVGRGGVLGNGIIRVQAQQQADPARERHSVGRLHHEHAAGLEQRAQELKHQRGRGVQVLDHLGEDHGIIHGKAGRHVSRRCARFKSNE